VYSSFNTPDSFTFRAAVKNADYTASGLQSGAVYYFRVSAVAGGEKGPMSKSARAQAAASAAVGAPTGLSASALSPARITVTWNGVSGAVLYYIYRTTGANSAGLMVDYTIGTSYTDTGLAGNTTYYYRVSAYKNGAETEKSAAATVTTLLPQPPTGLSVTDVSGNYIGLSWEASEGAAAYNVYRASASGSYTKIAQTATLAFTDTGLSTGATYYYHVSAVANGGESGYASISATAHTVPSAAPEISSVTAGSGAGAALSGTPRGKTGPGAG
jgi:fibronectin type 3 domain-containing protein